MNNNSFTFEYYPIVTQVQRVNGKDYAIAYQPDFDYRVMEIYQPKLQSQMASLIYRVQSELKIKIQMRNIEQKPLPIPSKPKGSFDLNEQSELKTCDVARILSVSNMTVVRWANDGTLASEKTIKGHRRFKRSDVEKLIPKEKSSPTPPLPKNLPVIQTVTQITKSVPKISEDIPEVELFSALHFPISGAV